jgi:hypothetical protein
MAYNNNGGGNRQFPQREKNVLDDRRLSMSAPTPNVKGKWASWNWGYFGNLARVTIWTNDPEDAGNNNGKIDVKMPLTDFKKLLECIDWAIELDHDDKMCFEYLDYSWFGGKKSEQVEVQATFWVGKTDGVVWISMLSPKRERPKIQFKFGATMYNQFKKADGSPVDDATMSRIVARANVSMLHDAVTALAVRDYKEKEKKDNQGGGQGGGQRNGGGNYGGGGGSRDSGSSGGGGGYDQVDDDIPF